MKKIFLSFVVALFGLNLSAQQLNESFDGQGFPPEDWSVINSDSYSCWRKSAKEGRECAMVPGSYGTENWLITPQLKPANGEKLTFDARVGEFAKNGQLRVEVSLTGIDASSFTLLETFYTSSAATSNKIPKTDWKTFTVDLSAYKNQRIYIAFHQYGEADKIYLDDVKGVTLGGNATCDVPTNIVVSNITDEGATISWQGTAAQYQYVLAQSGEAADWANAQLVSEKSVVITDLYEDTSYDFYVRSYCSATEQSLAPKTAFRTTCALQAIPWGENFTRDATGAFAPDCWTVASTKPQVWVVADKTYDDEGNASTITGQAHLGVAGGGPNTTQVFALPAFKARLDTLEVAFDYHTQMVSNDYGRLEVGYMTNPSDANTFVSIQTVEQTLTDKHAVCSLADAPATAKFIAFRFAGGTSDFGSLSMDNFVVAAIGKSSEYVPQEPELDAGIYGLTYCEAQFTWYSYNADAFGIGLFDVETEDLIAGIVVTTGECDRFAYEDKQNGIFSGFSMDDDYENHYYCATRWILNVDESGVSKGDAWNTSVINVGTATTPLLGLRPGKYQVQIYEYDGASLSNKLATIPFELTEKKVTNLQVAIADNKTSATLTWDEPTLDVNERVYASVRAGETIAFDNFSDTKLKAVSPLALNVEEGKSYNAILQIVDKNNNPLGPEVQLDFTVGVNNYEPQNPTATVFSGDNVTFEWTATTQADRYVITLFVDGEFYSTLTVNGFTKTTTMPKDGTWTWTVQAFNVGSNGNYFPASNEIPGNDFQTKGADIPEDAIVMNVWGMEAAYLDEYESQFPTGKYGYMIMFATGEEGGTGMPMPWFLVYTDKADAISGVYNVARGNLDLESTYMNTNGTQAGCIMAKDAELRLQFDGFDEDYFAQGYAYGYYTGQFRMVTTDGKTYVGKIMEQFCNSYNFSTYGNVYRDHHGMWDEEISNGIEEVLTEAGFDMNKPIFNVLGQQVDATYRGILIQNGHKYIVR